MLVVGGDGCTFVLLSCHRWCTHAVLRWQITVGGLAAHQMYLHRLGDGGTCEKALSMFKAVALQGPWYDETFRNALFIVRCGGSIYRAPSLVASRA